MTPTPDDLTSARAILARALGVDSMEIAVNEAMSAMADEDEGDDIAQLAEAVSDAIGEFIAAAQFGSVRSRVAAVVIVLQQQQSLLAVGIDHRNGPASQLVPL